MKRAGRSGVILISAVTALVTPLVVIAPTADAAGLPARIQGSHSTKLTITKLVNIFGEKNHTGTKAWVMTPKCAAGACNTALKRPSIQSTKVFNQVLIPQANGTYKSTLASTADCLNSTTGAVVAANAYTSSTLIVLTPTATASGLVTKYKGTFKYTITRRSTAPKSCAATGEEDGTFISPP